MKEYSKYNTYKWAAEKNDRDFEMSEDQVDELLVAPCQYCRIAPAGDIDRRDTRDHYTLENCIPCCRFCKAILRKTGKAPIDKRELVAWLKRVSNVQTAVSEKTQC